MRWGRKREGSVGGAESGGDDDGRADDDGADDGGCRLVRPTTAGPGPWGRPRGVLTVEFRWNDNSRGPNCVSLDDRIIR